MAEAQDLKRSTRALEAAVLAYLKKELSKSILEAPRPRYREARTSGYGIAGADVGE